VGRYVLRRQIAAPPERVFQAFVDPALAVDWMDLAAIRNATGPLDTPGTRFKMDVRGRWGFQNEILRSEPPTLHEQQGRGPLGAWFRHTANLTASAGGTDLELETEYALPLGPIGRLLDRLFLEGGSRTVANRELDRLVAIVSGGARS
jgi:hypothetical protein